VQYPQEDSRHEGRTGPFIRELLNYNAPRIIPHNHVRLLLESLQERIEIGRGDGQDMRNLKGRPLDDAAA
jgi:hypothetical protein